jgi:hypothetical protein
VLVLIDETGLRFQLCSWNLMKRLLFAPLRCRVLHLINLPSSTDLRQCMYHDSRFILSCCLIRARRVLFDTPDAEPRQPAVEALQQHTGFAHFLRRHPHTAVMRLEGYVRDTTEHIIWLVCRTHLTGHVTAAVACFGNHSGRAAAVLHKAQLGGCLDDVQDCARAQGLQVLQIGDIMQA